MSVNRMPSSRFSGKLVHSQEIWWISQTSDFSHDLIQKTTSADDRGSWFIFIHRKKRMAKCSIFLQSMGDARDVFFSIMPPYGQSRISGRQGRFTVHVNKVCPSVFGGRNMENGLFL
jgi:hypothetical protein